MFKGVNEWDELNIDLNNKLDMWFNKYIQFTQKDYLLNKFTNDYWLLYFFYINNEYLLILILALFFNLAIK
jgi:hypothetical protein